MIEISLLVYLFQWDSNKHSANNNSIINIFNNINSGDSWVEVYNIVKKNSTGLVVKCSINSNECIVHSPPDLAMQNYVLSIKQQKGKVTSVVLGTLDGNPVGKKGKKWGHYVASGYVAFFV